MLVSRSTDFFKRMWGLSSIFSKRCMVLLGFLWFVVVFFLPSFYSRDGDWDKWLSAVLLLSTAARWLSADTCLVLVLMGYGLKPSFLNLPQMDTHVKHQGLGTYQLVGRISATVLSGEWPVFQKTDRTHGGTVMSVPFQSRIHSFAGFEFQWFTGLHTSPVRGWIVHQQYHDDPALFIWMITHL